MTVNDFVKLTNILNYSVQHLKRMNITFFEINKTLLRSVTEIHAEMSKKYYYKKM